MIRRLCLGLLAQATLAATATAVAGAEAARAAEPTDLHAEVPALRHASALERYRRWSPEPTGDWRGAHATVARIGGWRAYLREANSPEPAASAPAASTTRPGPASSGHLHRGGGCR